MNNHDVCSTFTMFVDTPGQPPTVCKAKFNSGEYVFPFEKHRALTDMTSFFPTLGTAPRDIRGMAVPFVAVTNPLIGHFKDPVFLESWRSDYASSITPGALFTPSLVY